MISNEMQYKSFISHLIHLLISIIHYLSFEIDALAAYILFKITLNETKKVFI